MKYRQSGDKYIVKVEKDEKVVEELEKFCQSEQIVNAQVMGVGAVDWAKVAHYNVGKKEYKDFELEEPLEMISLLGNVFLGEDGKRIIHLHVSLGRPDGSMVGGHLVEANISAACEIVVFKLETKLGKKYDEVTGLKLLEM